MQSRYFLPILLLATSFASAQSGIGIGRANTDNLPGDLILPPGSFNITQTLVDQLVDDGTGYNDIRGILQLPNGNPDLRTYLVSHGPEGRPTKKYMEIEVDTTNGDVTVVLSVDSPYINGAAGDFGTTDIGWDHDTSADSRVWAGYAKGMGSYDWQTQTFDPIFNPLKPGYGFKVLTGWLGNNVRAGTVAVWDGQKVFVSSDANEESNFHAIDIGNFSSNAPKWIEPTPFPPVTLGTFDSGRLGGAFNPNSETVWWHVDHADSNPNPNMSGSRFHEMDRDGNWTGKIIQGRRDVGGQASGCGIYIDGNGNAILTYVVDMQGLDNILGLTEGHDVAAEMYIDFNFGSSCQGDIGYLNEPYISAADFTVTLTDGGSNPLLAAILFRGNADPVGFQVPGINNCPLNISLANFRNLGAIGLNNGEASYVQNLPDDINLVGIEATYQWLLPTSVNVLPLDLSDAGAIRVGSNL